MGRLAAEAETADLPPETRMPLDLLAGQFRDTRQRLDTMTARLKVDAEKNGTACPLQTVPGVGPITAGLLVATLPDVPGLRSARIYPPCWPDAKAAFEWRQGEAELHLQDGRRFMRRLLYLGAMGECMRKLSDPGTDWLGPLITTRPLKGAAIALANRMARAIWAMPGTGEV